METIDGAKEEDFRLMQILRNRVRGGCTTSIILASCLFAGTTTAATFPSGFISWDIVFSGNAGQFDITNQTGPNASVFPDTTFPIATKLALSSLSLMVDFSNGSHTTFGSSYFTLSADNQSFDGSPIPIGGTNPLPISAT